MSELLDLVSQGLVPKTVGVHEFAESSDFCNKTLYPRQVVLLKLVFLEEMTGDEEDILSEWIDGSRNNEITISPNIRERRDFLREEGYLHFREVELVGGRRSSKGFITGVGMAKVMFDTLQLGDPGEHYGIDPEHQIYFSCIAGSEAQAKEFQYADFASTIETCKAFEPYLVKSLETEFRVATSADLRRIGGNRSRGHKIQRDIAKLRGKALASNAGTLRGSATMTACIDEMAHMLPGESKASADLVYTALGPSLDQFGIDGMLWLNSSPYSKVGKFYDLYDESLRPFDPKRPIEYDHDSDSEEVPNGDPRMMMFQFPSWALFDRYRKYKSRWKQRERGRSWDKAITVSPDWDPEEKDAAGDAIHSIKDKQNIMAARQEEAKNPEAYKVERRGKFAEVTDAFLNPAMVDRMYQGIPDGTQIQVDGSLAQVYRPYFTNYGEGALNTFRYKFHCDPSSTTAGFGFAIAHIEYFVNPNTGQDEEHVVFDIIKRWDPKSFGGVIRWAPILAEIVTYADIFRPFEITFDQHQSVEPIQTLQEKLAMRNIVCQVYEKTATNELNWKRWEVFKTALYQGLIHGPCDESQFSIPTCQNELKFLQEIKTGGKYSKVEKQDVGPVKTKDQADCASECVYSLIGNLMLTRMRERLANSIVGGGQGGYGIGQGGPGGPVGGDGPPGISGYYSSQRDKVIDRGLDKASLTRGALGQRGKTRGSRSRGRW